MSDPNKLLRRNFTVALVAHGALVGGLFVGEQWLPDFQKPFSTPVQLVVPADILGELPQGPGHGRGAYTPPKEPAGSTRGGGVPEAAPPPSTKTYAADETPAPKPSPSHQSDEIAIPKPTKKPVKTTPVKTTNTKTTKPTKTEQGRNTTSTQVASAKPALSAEQSRNGFLNALRRGGSGSGIGGFGGGGVAREGGTPYGDNRPTGGGKGKGPLGSPDGAPDGVPWGVGQGSPNWRYYQHVHDKMYEGWDQSAALNDRKLMSVVMVKIARDGSIVGVALKRSSGNRRMDELAVAAARKVRMLEPPPDALVKGSCAEIAVEFQLEG